MPKSLLRTINDHGKIYRALAFICPGCILFGYSGLHMLTVNSLNHSPSWTWNQNLELPTLTPSILTGKGSLKICHSYLTDGVFKFLNDCTHPLAGANVPIPYLPNWFCSRR